MQSNENGIYRVEFSEQECSHCGAGKQWVVVDDEDAEVGGRTFGDEEEAGWFAEYMNEAYRIGLEKGARSADGPDPLPPPVPAEIGPQNGAGEAGEPDGKPGRLD